MTGLLVALLMQSLQTTINSAINRPELHHAVWAIDVEDDAGKVLYAKSAHTLVMPASNRKIFSAATVLDCQGPDKRFTTELWRDGNNLVIRGSGDPGLGGRWAFDRDAVFTEFVSAVHSRGITAVEDIIADVSAFDRQTIPGSWKIGNLGNDYAAPVEPLAYNENVVGVAIEHCSQPVMWIDPAFVDGVETVTCGEGTPTAKIDVVGDENVLRVSGAMSKRFNDLPSVASPGLYAAQALRDALRRAGIAVHGVLRVNITPQPWPERLAAIESMPLWELLTITLRSSQNLYAEMLFKTLAGTYEGAETVEEDFLTGAVGIDPDEFRFVDGSGLSSDDLATAAAVVKMFRWMNEPARRGLYTPLLAVPAEEGTLRKRLAPLATRLRGKTGTIAGVNALSGIVRGRNGGYRYFSVIINHHTAASSVATKAIDDIVLAIADF